MSRINNVTDTDLEMLIASGQDVATRAIEFNSRMYQGKVEELKDPIPKALELLAVSRSLADLSVRILAKAEVQQDTDALKQEMQRRAKA